MVTHVGATLFTSHVIQLTWRSTPVVRNFCDVQRGLSFLLYHFVVFFSLLVAEVRAC